MFGLIIKNRILKNLTHIECGGLILAFPDGTSHIFKGQAQGPKADIQIKTWKVIKNFVFKGDIGLTEDYRRGNWDTSNLPALLTFALQNSSVFQALADGKWWYRHLTKLVYFTQRNTLKGSKQNIQAHYDLGNDFYQLWLDSTMTYSSAIYQTQRDSLTTAQLQKYDRIIERIPKSGDLIEIGCGWGGFADRLLSKTQYQYTGITLSREQQAFAIDRLPDQAQVLLEDYRIQTGQYDAIVSIEMLEAVGQKYWPIYFKKIKSLLKPGGKAMIQTIVVSDQLFKRYAKGTDMIRTYIFPGGMLPSINVLKKEVKKSGLKWMDCFSFGDSYAKTLFAWLNAFDSHSQKLVAMGYDEQFQKLWRFYLAGCIATFTTKRTDVVMLELSLQEQNDGTI